MTTTASHYETFELISAPSFLWYSYAILKCPLQMGANPQTIHPACAAGGDSITGGNDEQKPVCPFTDDVNDH